MQEYTWRKSCAVEILYRITPRHVVASYTRDLKPGIPCSLSILRKHYYFGFVKYSSRNINIKIETNNKICGVANYQISST